MGSLEKLPDSPTDSPGSRAREAKVVNTASNNKKKLQALHNQVQSIREEMKTKGKKFKFTILTLKPLVRWKMNSANHVNANPKRGDAVPTSKPNLLKSSAS